MGNCLTKFCCYRRNNKVGNNERLEETNDQTIDLVQSPKDQVKNKPLINSTEENNYQTTNTEQTQDEQVENKALNQRIEDDYGQTTNTEQTKDEQVTNKPHKQGQKKKLKSFFQHIILNAPVDFSIQEIQDIQDAVHTMLERIRTRVNKRGIFNIDRIVPTGSMADKTAIWKYDDYEKESFLEFDNLAVLKESVRQCEDHGDYQRCPGCIRISKLPLNLNRMPIPKHEFDPLTAGWNLIYNAIDLDTKGKINDIFLYEINKCLASSCGCLTFHTHRLSYSFQSSSLNTINGCDKCTVDKPTGSLSVNTNKAIDPNSRGLNNCSLVLIWTSTTNRLLAPDKLLQQKQPIISMPIYIDFLPAIESLKPTSRGARYTHGYFDVSKRCNKCFVDREYRCRRSWCMAEIQAFRSRTSHKHRKCYQITKYLAKDPWCFHVNKYLLKNVVLQHSTTCSDTSDNYVDCVIKVYQDIVNAFKSKEFLSYQSNINILSNTHHAYRRKNKAYYQEFLRQLYSVSETDTFDSFVTRLWSSCKSAANNAVSYAQRQMLSQ